MGKVCSRQTLESLVFGWFPETDIRDYWTVEMILNIKRKDTETLAFQNERGRKLLNLTDGILVYLENKNEIKNHSYIQPDKS